MSADWFDEIFNKQIEFQKMLLNKTNLEPDPVVMYNSATCAIVEIGEMLQEDTRWKTKMGSTRPARYDKDAFALEFAEVFIYLINVLIYSGISCEEIKEIVRKKININWNRKK